MIDYVFDWIVQWFHNLDGNIIIKSTFMASIHLYLSYNVSCDCTMGI